MTIPPRQSPLAHARSDIYMAIRNTTKEWNLTDAEVMVILIDELKQIAGYGMAKEWERPE